MEVQSIVTTNHLVDLNSLLESLRRDGKGMFFLSLHILKLFEKYQFDKNSIFDFCDKKCFCMHLTNKGINDVIRKSYKFPYANRPTVILMGSFLISAKVDCLRRRFDFYKFKEMVKDTDKFIYGFLGRNPIPVYSKDVSSFFRNRSFLIRQSRMGRNKPSLYDLNENGIMLRYPPQKILIGNFVIDSLIYPIEEKIL